MLTKEQLIDIGAEKLAEIILSLYKNNSDIQTQLEIAFTSFDSDPEKIISIIKEEIESLTDSGGFEYYESDKLADQVNQVRILIIEKVLPKSPDDAIELLLNLLDNYKDIITQVKDDDGSTVEEVFQQAYADLRQAYEKTTNCLDDVVDLVYNRFMNNDYCLYDKIIWDFKDILADNGLSLLKQKLEKTPYQKFTTTVKEGLIDIADCQNDVDAYIKACSFNGKPDAKDHLKIAKRLIKHCRGIEANKWLDSKGEIFRWREDEHEALKIQALNLYSDNKAAQAERLNWFETSLSPKVFSEILKNAEVDFVESFKKTAIQTALDFPDPHVALTLFKEIQEFEPAAKLVRLKCDTLDTNKYFLRTIAEVLCKIDPLAATLLYRHMIQPLIMGTDSYHLNDAAKDLATCYSLSSKIADWQKYQNHQLYFEEVSKQNPHVALICLKEIQEFEQAAKLVRLKFDTLDAKKHYTLRPIADALCEIDPLASTLLYRQLIQPVLMGDNFKFYNNAAKTKYCNNAAKDLATCHNISSKITDWQKYQNHQLYFTEVSRQLKRKTSFWREYTSELNKRPKM